MFKQDSLIQGLSNHFSLHPSRKETLAALILGALNSGCVQHHALSHFVASPTPEAATRRVERFFKRS